MAAFTPHRDVNLLGGKKKRKGEHTSSFAGGRGRGTVLNADGSTGKKGRLTTQKKKKGKDPVTDSLYLRGARKKGRRAGEKKRIARSQFISFFVTTFSAGEKKKKTGPGRKEEASTSLIPACG